MSRQFGRRWILQRSLGQHASIDKTRSLWSTRKSICQGDPSSGTRHGYATSQASQHFPPQLTMMTVEDDKCMLKLYSTGGSDLVAWYQIWEAVEATFAICARQREGGSFRDLGWLSDIVMRDGGRIRKLTYRPGVQHKIFLTLGNRPPTLLAGNLSDDAVA